jgi:hypothetical protein
MLLSFSEFLFENDVMVKKLQKRNKFIKNRWVCLIVTDKTQNDFFIKYPEQPFNILIGSHKIILNTKKQLDKAKNKYRIGNIYNNENIIDVNIHPYNPLIDI